MFGIISKLFAAKSGTSTKRETHQSAFRSRLGLEGLEYRDMPSSTPVSIVTLAALDTLAIHEDALNLVVVAGKIEIARPSLDSKQIDQDIISLGNDALHGTSLEVLSGTIRLLSDAVTEVNLTSQDRSSLTPLLDYTSFLSATITEFHDQLNYLALVNYADQHETATVVTQPLNVATSPSISSLSSTSYLNNLYQLANEQYNLVQNQSVDTGDGDGMDQFDDSDDSGDSGD